ncbi:hypothetical protein [Desulforapulum autotrophicum]|nr:hypothetical protein [Desulforapulum autotrophicum]
MSFLRNACGLVLVIGFLAVAAASCFSVMDIGQILPMQPTLN